MLVITNNFLNLKLQKYKTRLKAGERDENVEQGKYNIYCHCIYSEHFLVQGGDYPCYCKRSSVPALGPSSSPSVPSSKLKHSYLSAAVTHEKRFHADKSLIIIGQHLLHQLGFSFKCSHKSTDIDYFRSISVSLIEIAHLLN